MNLHMCMPVARLRPSYIGAVALTITTLSASATGYVFHDLGTLGGLDSQGNSINAAGQVVGYSQTGTGIRATLWGGGNVIDLGTLPGTANSFAYGINSAGWATGYSRAPATTAGRATLWSGSAPIDLGTLGGTYSAGFALNNAGTVVGESQVAGDATTHATAWTIGSAPTDLGTLGGPNSKALAINAAGLVVGVSDTTSTGDHGWRATLWNGTVPVELTTPYDNARSYANAINDVGQVAGGFRTGTGEYAARWDNGSFIELGSLSSNGSTAFGVNNVGQAVGAYNSESDYQAHAVLWNGLTPIDLNSLLDTATVQAGWLLIEALAINDSGWITGSAVNAITGQRHAYLLSPVPETGTLPQILAGLVVLLVATRSAHRARRDPP